MVSYGSNINVFYMHDCICIKLLCYYDELYVANYLFALVVDL